jgi:putative SOS response-associated peptidase YedK
MCGRFALYSSISDLKKAFAVDAVTGEMKPGYNIAPSDEIYAIIQQKERRMEKLHWGLVPAWAKNPSLTSGLINARVETLHEKPSFKRAFQKRRCLIPANGFYEWKDKQPWYFIPAKGNLFGFAGLWETWKGSGEAVYNSCAIITTEASESMQKIHDRMPLILKPEAIDEWLNPAIEGYDRLNMILKNGREPEVKPYLEAAGNIHRVLCKLDKSGRN